MALDRSGPVFYARVGAAGSQSPARLPVGVRLMSMTFDEEEAKADELTLTVDNHDLSHFDNPLFAVGNVVEVCWGYPGAMGRVRECTVTKVGGGTQLKVACKGKSHVANLVARSRVFTNVRRSDVARQLAEEHGLGAVADVDETAVVLDHVAQSRETDAQFLRGLAHKEGFDYGEDGTGFHFHARRVGARPVRRFTYSVGSPGDVESFTVEGDVTAKPAVVVAAGRDPLTKEDFSARGDDAGTAGRPAGAPVALVSFTKAGAVDLAGLAKLQAGAADAGVHVVATTAKTKEDAQVQVNATFTRSQQKAVKVTLHCVGDALVEAKQVVELAGFGRVLDGNYHVSSAKHPVGPGYKMTLKLTRDGVGSQSGMGANAPDAEGKVNDARGPAAVDQAPFASVGKDGAVSWKVGGPKP